MVTEQKDISAVEMPEEAKLLLPLLRVLKSHGLGIYQLDDEQPKVSDMTLHDWFAGMALSGTDWEANIGNVDEVTPYLENLVDRCYQIAQMMMACRTTDYWG